MGGFDDGSPGGDFQIIQIEEGEETFRLFTKVLAAPLEPLPCPRPLRRWRETCSSSFTIMHAVTEHESAPEQIVQEDKLKLRFTENTEGGFNVQATGHNLFYGHFTIVGSVQPFSLGGAVSLYK